MAVIQTPQGPRQLVNWHLGLANGNATGRHAACSNITCSARRKPSSTDYRGHERLAKHPGERAFQRSPL